MCSFNIIYILICILNLYTINGTEISDKRLCVDKLCSVPISVGKTTNNYVSPDARILSFARNVKVIVYSYPAGKNTSYFYVEIDGKKGYVPKGHVREVELLKKPKILVETEVFEEKPKVPSHVSEIQVDPVQEAFEFVDGTKIPIDPHNFVKSGNTGALPSVSSSTERTEPLENSRKIDRKLESRKNEGNVDSGIHEQIETEEDFDDDSDGEENDDDDDDEDERPNTEKYSDSVKSLTDIQSFQPATEDVLKNKIMPPSDVENNIKIESNGKENIIDNTSDTKEASFKEDSTDKVELILTTEVPILEEALPPLELDNVTPDPNLSAGLEEKLKSKDTADDLNQDSGGVLEAIGGKLIDIFSSATENRVMDNKESVNGRTHEADEEIIIKSEDIIESNKKLENQMNAEHVLQPDTLGDATKIKIEAENVTLKADIDQGEEENKEETILPPDESEVIKQTLPHKEEISSLNSSLLSNIETNKESTVAENEKVYLSSITTPQREITPSASLEIQQNFPELDHTILESSRHSKDDFGEKKTDKSLSLSSRIEAIQTSNKEEIDNTKDDHHLDVSTLNQGIDGHSTLPATSDVTFPFFGVSEVEEKTSSDEAVVENLVTNVEQSVTHIEEKAHQLLSKESAFYKEEFCDISSDNCPPSKSNIENLITSGSSFNLDIILQGFSSDMFLYLSTTAMSVILFLFGYLLLDKCKREGPLIAHINKLERQLLTTLKENQMLQEKASLHIDQQPQIVAEPVPNEQTTELSIKLAEALNRNASLEDQIQALEKELDNSTEVGIELNRIISEMLNSTDGNEILKDNIEQMQKKILEQQDTINSMNESLNLKGTEIHELHLELDISNKKVGDLQVEVDKLVEKLLKIEEEKDQQQSSLEQEIVRLQQRIGEAVGKEIGFTSEIQSLNSQLSEAQRASQIKTKEYDILKESLNEIKSTKNKGETIKSLLEVSEVKAQLQQFKVENSKFLEQLSLEREANIAYAARIESLSRDLNELRQIYEKADKEKVESSTKLQVLDNYFKEKEEQMQKEIAKYESLWAVKEGEATSTTERIRLLQEELQNYKAQNESLKQEIINQEVELKSQISVLEKKIHDNWVTSRQTERKLEEARQEAAQLRNRLTLKECSLTEGNNPMRLQSPLQQNGELPLSPPPLLDATISPPPPLFNARDLTMSPPIPGMPPPPFLPPPPGAPPFMPPPLGGLPPGMPPFMPPLPHGMFPGDHRPPPLGRMSSPPPLNSRYSPDSVAYSEYDRYDRNTPSPIYDSEYGVYNDYDNRLRDDRREYKRPQARSNGRNSKGVHSSGSENDSLGKKGRKPGKKV